MTATHPPEADLVAYSLGQLGDAESGAIEDHLAGCPACQARVAAVPPDTLVGLFVAVAPQLDAPLCATVPAGELRTPSFIPPTLTWEPRAAPPAGTSDPPPVPAELANHPKYRVLKWLGDGGMGSVWLVEHLVMRNRVAVKVIRPELLAQPGARERFLREIRAVSRLEHPNIVRALDAEASGRLCLFAMEYVQGRTLAQVVRAHGPLAPAEACAAVRDAARGLAHAHAQGMVHRDVKPHNLMRTNDGTVKVLDFGLALVASGTEAGVRRGETAMCGTPDYMAPEQFGAAGTADDRADVYGLGCTLYHLLAGRPPFAGGTLADKCAAHSVREPDPIPDLPHGLGAVLAQLMAKRPEDRFQSADEVIDALAPFCPGAEPPEPAPAARSRRRGPAVALAVLACALLFATGAAVYRFQTDTGDLVIETTDDDIEVLVKQGGQVVTVFDPRTQQKVTLRSGEYEFEINGKPAGLKLSLDSATLKRGDIVVAKITRTEPRVSTTGGEVAQKPGGTHTAVPKLLPPPKPQVPTDRAELGLSGHANALLYGPDGKRVLVGGGDGTVAVWTPGDAKPVRAFAEAHPAGITRLAWSANGTRAATADAAGNVWLWDAVAGTRTRAFAGASGCVGVGFLPNGRVWIVRQNGADVFDPNTGTSELRFAPPAGELFHCAAATPDGKRVLTGSHFVLRQWDAGTGKELAPLGRHPAWIGTVAVSADGTRAAAGCNNSVVSLWNLATEQLLARRVACKWHTAAMCFSPDGTRLAFTGSHGDPALRVIDADTGAELTVVTRTAYTLLPAFTPDGTKVLTGQPNGRVFIDPVPQLILQERLSRKQDGNLYGLSFLANGAELLAHGQRATLWNAESGQVVRQYAATQTARAAVNRDGTAVAAWCDACALVHMFDTTTGKELQQFGPVRRNSSWPMQFARDGSLLLGENNRLRRTDPKSGKIEELWSADEGTQLRFCELSPDERLLLVPETTTHPNGSREAALLVLDSATRKVAGRILLPGVPQNGVRMAKWSGRGTVIVGILGTGELLGFDWPSGRPLYRVKAHQSEGNLAAFADGRRVASVSNDGRLAIWDATTGDKLGEANTGAATWGVAVSPDGRTVATGSTGGELKIWNVVAPGAVRDVRMTGRWDGHTGIVSDVALTGDGKRAVSVDGHGLVIVHDGAKVLKSFKTEAEAFTSLALSPDEKVVALGCAKNAIKWYDLDTGKELGGVTNPTGRVRGVAFTADGKHLFAAGYTGAALWDRATGKAVRNFDCAGLACHWGALSPDGTRALVAGGRADGSTHGKEGEVRVFDTNTGKRVQTLTGPDATISHAIFSNDGGRVVAACIDGTARVWALDTGKQEHVFRHRAGSWVQRAALTSDGRQLVTAFNLPAARATTDGFAVWDLRTGRAAYSNEPSSGGYSLALTPNGLTALVGDYAGGTVRAYALPAPSQVGALQVSDFRTASGLDAAELKKWAAELPRGFRPADVTARAGAKAPRFDAVAICDGSVTPFALSTELGTADRPYLIDFNAMSEKGYSLRAVATYPNGDQLLRHQLWVKDGRGWHGSGHLERDLPAAATDWRKRGLRPTGFHETRAPMGGQPLVGVVLGPDDGWEWEFHKALTQPELLALWLRARDRGWRIDALSGFGTGAARRYAITLVNDPFAPAWDLKTDLTAAKFEEEVAAQRKRGLRPLAVTSHGDGAAVRYDAVWVEFSPAR